MPGILSSLKGIWLVKNSLLQLKAKVSFWWTWHTSGAVVDTQTDRHPHNGLFSRTTWVINTRKVKPVWILMKQEMMVWQYWKTCKSFAPHSRQITTPAPHQ